MLVEDVHPAKALVPMRDIHSPVAMLPKDGAPHEGTVTVPNARHNTFARRCRSLCRSAFASGMHVFGVLHKDVHAARKGTVPNVHHKLNHHHARQRCAPRKGTGPNVHDRITHGGAHQRRALCKGFFATDSPIMVTKAR